MSDSKSVPKYQRVREELRRRIERGEFPPGSRLPPQTELFRILNASDSTVLRALNDLVRAGLIVRRRRSGTFVAPKGQPPLIAGRTLRLALLCYSRIAEADLGRGFLGALIHGVLSGWRIEGVHPEFFANNRLKTGLATWRQPERGLTIDCVGEAWDGQERRPSLEAVRAGQYDGIVSLGIIEENWLEQVLGLGVPAVLVDFPAQTLRSQADTVFADPYYAYRAAVENMLARGCRRIHFVGARVRNPNRPIPGKKTPEGWNVYGRRVDPDSFLRLSAYRHAMDAMGAEVQEDWIHFVDLEADAHEAFARKLARKPRDRWPQAVICHGVNQAEWLMKSFENRNWRIVGAGASGGTHFGEALALPVNAKEMGEVAADLLVARLERPDRPYLNVGVRVAPPPSGARAERQQK